MTITVLDNMEYGSDALALSNYATTGDLVTSVTGGTITRNGSKVVHKFTSSGTFAIPSGLNGNVEVLIVAGGGGGGKAEANPGGDGAGGGGAGGLIYNSAFAVSEGDITVTVGNGGLGTTSGTYPHIQRGQNGTNSIFGSLTAIGGGGGGSDNDNHEDLNKGADGGSGGGASNSYGVAVYGSSGTSGQGYAGGAADTNTTSQRGGSGGGGAGGDGVKRTSGLGGAGGAGVSYSISGSSMSYATGGKGGNTTGSSTGANGSVNTGNGGGGGNSNNGSGGNGGSGIVIVSYNIGEFGSSLTLRARSEVSITSEGTYSLKAIAAQTTSLNKTLTRTIASPINLSGHAYIIGKIRSNRTGSNIKIGFHDSGGTTTEVTPNITAADTWQTIQLDISAVSDANKDAIDQIIITVVNADAENTFYLDNFFAATAADFALGMQVSKAVGYAVLYPIANALNVSKVVAYAVLGPYVEPQTGSGPMMWIF